MPNCEFRSYHTAIGHELRNWRRWLRLLKMQLKQGNQSRGNSSILDLTIQNEKLFLVYQRTLLSSFGLNTGLIREISMKRGSMSYLPSTGKSEQNDTIYRR